MNPIDRAKRIVDAAYARRTARPLTIALVTTLEQEVDALQKEINTLSRFGFVRSRRWVQGMTIGSLLLIFGLAIGTYWYRDTPEGYCLRAGIFDAKDRGSFESTEAVCQTHTGDSILSGKHAPVQDKR